MTDATSTPAAPAPAPAPGPPGGNAEPAAPAPGGWTPPETPEAAQAMLSSFRLDGEPAWVRDAYRNARHPGHSEAVERMQTIYRAANPAEAPATVQRTDPETGVPYNVPADPGGGAADEVPADATGYDAALTAAIPDHLADKIDEQDRKQAAAYFGALGLTRGEARTVAGLMVSKGAALEKLGREHQISGRGAEVAGERYRLSSAAAEKRLKAEWGDQYPDRIDAIKRMIRAADGKTKGLADTLANLGLLGSYDFAVLLDGVARRRGIK